MFFQNNQREWQKNNPLVPKEAGCQNHILHEKTGNAPFCNCGGGRFRLVLICSLLPKGNRIFICPCGSL